MSLIPAIKVGLWNAWILFPFQLPSVYFEVVNKEAMKRFRTKPSYSKNERILDRIANNVIPIITIVYSIFLPLKIGTVWFYVGLFVYLLAVIINTVAVQNFASTPLDEPVTKGVYRISRHPSSFGLFLMDIGIGVACTSWIFLLCAIVYIILTHILLPTEERFCLAKYGNTYREFMNGTPKWIGIPKSMSRRARVLS